MGVLVFFYVCACLLFRVCWCFFGVSGSLMSFRVVRVFAIVFVCFRVVVAVGVGLVFMFFSLRVVLVFV